MAPGKRGNSGKKSKAVLYSCDGNNPIQLRSFCQRGRKGWRRKKKEIWEEGGWEEWHLALPPGLHCRSSEVAGGEDLGDGDVCGAHQEEIQLNYTRTECIFNHTTSFPDVTVSLCARLRGILRKRSCHLSLSSPHSSRSSVDQQHNTQQLWQELIWCHERTFYSSQKKIPISTHKSCYYFTHAVCVCDTVVHVNDTCVAHLP